MVVGDRSGVVLAVNPAFCAIVERDQEELLGRDFRGITHPDDIAADEAALSELALEADRPIAFHIDGEYQGETEGVSFRFVPEALCVVA